jgi:serine/threonine-protein kinase
MIRHDTSAAGLSVDAAAELDRVCDAFESAWRSRCRPAIEPAVAALSDDVRSAAVRELIELDIYYRRRAGEHPVPADYAGRFPDLDPAWLYRVTRLDAPVPSTVTMTFGSDGTTEGWSRPPLLRDDPSDLSPVVRPGSPDMPRNDSGPYQCLGEIAQGGMGVILKGRDPALGRDLAVKVLKAEYAGRATAEARFVEEAQIGGQLQHPGIVPVYDLNRFSDGRPFFTMKLVKGRTLAEMLSERVSSADDRGRFLKVFEKVCDTIAYAHSRGVIHRDLKPSNVMVGAFGEVLVMDWGLAKVLPRGGIADEMRAVAASRPPGRPWCEPTIIQTDRAGSGGSDTQAGSVMGTPAFMPPEQAGGEVDKLDERADVFGLGAVLCVILTGQPPFVAVTAEATRLMAIRGELDEAFARLDADRTDAELVGLCKQCLAAKREARPRHAGEVAGAMSAYLAAVEARAQTAEVERAAAEARAAEEVKTRRVAEEMAVVERKRRRLQAVTGLAFTALVLTGGAGVWRVQSQRAARAAELAKEQSETEFIVTEAVGDANRSLHDGQWIDAAASIQRADDRLGPGESFPGLRAAVRQARADRAMALALERAHCAAFDMSEEGRRSTGNDVNFMATRAAFEAYGFPAWDMSTGAVRERLQASRIRQLLTEELVMLSLWYREPNPKDLYLPRLYTMMQQLDDDPYCGKLFNARQRKDTAAVLALAEDPQLQYHPTVTINRVVSYLREKNQPVSPAAFDNLRRIRQANPADFQLHRNLAKLLFEKGNPEDRREASGYMQVAVALRPQSSNIAVDLANFHIRAGQLDSAGTAYGRAIALDPTNPHARNGMGVVRLKEGDVARAVEEFREAIRLDPTCAVYHSNLGHLRALHDRKQPYRDPALSPRETAPLPRIKQ